MVGWPLHVLAYLLFYCLFPKAIISATVLSQSKSFIVNMLLYPGFSHDFSSNGLTFYYAVLLCLAILSLCFPLLDSSDYTTRWVGDDQVELQVTPTLPPRPTSRPTTRSTTRPTLPPRPTSPTVTLCEKHYSIWSYCEARHQRLRIKVFRTS